MQTGLMRSRLEHAFADEETNDGSLKGSTRENRGHIQAQADHL